MTVQQLRYFIAVAQYLHFGEAAKACYVSQPSLSHSIAELESELNIKLFYRDNRSVELSHAGKLFYEDVSEIVKKLDDAVIKAKRADIGHEGTLRVGSLGGLSAGDFLPKIAQFRSKYPDIDIELLQTNMRTLNMKLLKKEIDVALTRKLDVIHRSDELDWHVLYQDCFGIVLRSDHPLADHKDLKLTDLAAEPFIFLEQSVTPHVYNYTMQLCTSRGLVPNISHTANTLEIACTQIKAGLGIGILPECALAYSFDLLKFIPLDGEDAKSDVVIAWSRKTINPVVPIFLEEFGANVFLQ